MGTFGSPRSGRARFSALVTHSAVSLALMIAGMGVVVVPTLVAAAVVGLVLTTFALLRPRRFAAVAIALIMLPLPPAVFGVDPRVAVVVMLLLGTLMGLLRGRLGIEHRLLVVTAVLAGILTLSFVRTMEFATQLSRGLNLSMLLMGLASLVALASLRLPLADLLRPVALGGAATATIVLIRGDTTVDGRLTDLILNPNYLGLLLASSLVVLIGVPHPAGGFPGWVSELLRWMGAALTALALVMTQSRGAVLATSLGLIALICLNLRLRVQMAIVVGATALLCAVPGLTDAVGSGPIERPAEELATNNASRLDAARLAVRYTVDNPLLGVGYATFSDRGLADSSSGLYVNTHNDYLRLGAEAGLPALLAFLLLLQPLAWAPRRSRLERTGLAVAVTHLVGILFANSLANLQVTIPFWAVLAWAWASRRTIPSRDRDESTMQPLLSGRQEVSV